MLSLLLALTLAQAAPAGGACKDATTTRTGCVTTGAQSFAGNKTFTGTLTGAGYAGGNVQALRSDASSPQFIANSTSATSPMYAYYSMRDNGTVRGQFLSVLRSPLNDKGSMYFDYNVTGAANAFFAIRKVPDSDADTVLAIDAAGRVGIGTGALAYPSTLTAKLTVGGTLSTTGNAFPTANGTYTSGTAALAWNAVYSNNIVAPALSLALGSQYLVIGSGGGATNLSSDIFAATATSSVAALNVYPNRTLDADDLVVAVKPSSGGSVVASVDLEGDAAFGKVRLSNQTLPTCAAAIEGTLSRDVGSGIATGKRTKLCLCSSDGSSTYVWQNVVTGTLGTTTTCGTE